MLTEASYSIKAAIDAINSSAKYVIVGDTVAGISWLENTTPIAADVLNAKITELKAAYDAEEYKRKRVLAYPGLPEQFDLLYWDQVNGTSKFKEAIAKVKAVNPKP